MSFCPACGTNTEKLYDGLCEKCFLERNLIIQPPTKINVYICPECGKTVYEEPKFLTNLEEFDLEIIYTEDEAHITVFGKIQDIPVEKEFVIPLKKHFKKCDRCVKIKQENYVVKIQLRHAENTDIETYRKYEFLLSKISDWKKELKEGTDFFFIDKKTPQRILKRLKNKGYSITSSYTFKGIKHGKKKIQYTYCIRV